MELYDIIEDAVKSDKKSIFIYGENHDNGIIALINVIKENFTNKKVLFLTNAMKNVQYFNFVIKNCNSKTNYRCGTNLFHFDNIHQYWGAGQDDIIIVYPADDLLLDSIHKDNHKNIDKILFANSEKTIFLTEYSVKNSNLDYLISKVDESIEIIDKE